MKLSFPKVLLIDDDKAFGEALSRWLSQLGYQPSVAASASQAVTLLNQTQFEAILLDLQLPDISGHAIIRQLNHLGVATPVVVVSGTTEIDDVVRAWRENAVDFLRKPFRIEDLSAALEKALKRTAVHTLAAPPANGAISPSEAGHAVANPAAASPAAASPAAPNPPARPAALTAPSGAPGQLRPAVAKLVETLKAGGVRLPILDPRVVRLPEFLTSQNWTLEELADTVTRDSNFAAAILRSANSAAQYTRGKEITSVRDACARLGAKAVVAIAFEITVRGQFTAPKEPYKTALKESWRNAVVASRVAPVLGEMLRLPNREDLRLVTLFQNLGELLALCLLADLERPAGAEYTTEHLAKEVDAMHEDLGAALATSWKLPASVIRIAGRHHRPATEQESKDDKVVRHIVLASWAIALRAGFTYFPRQDTIQPGRFLQVLGLTEEQIAPVYEMIKTWPEDS